MVTRYVAPSVVVAILLVYACPQRGVANPPPEGPKRLSICELVEHQDLHDGESVRVRARLQTDAIEHTFAADTDPAKECAVLIRSSSTVDSNTPAKEHLDHLSSALTKAHHTSTESHNKIVQAELFGVFHRDESKTYMPSLELTDAIGVKIVEGAGLVPPIPPKPK